MDQKEFLSKAAAILKAGKLPMQVTDFEDVLNIIYSLFQTIEMKESKCRASLDAAHAIQEQLRILVLGVGLQYDEIFRALNEALVDENKRESLLIQANASITIGKSKMHLLTDTLKSNEYKMRNISTIFEKEYSNSLKDKLKGHATVGLRWTDKQ